MNHLIAGGAQAIVSGLAGKKLEKVTGDIPYLAEKGEDVHCDIKAMVDCLRFLCEKAERDDKPFYQTVVLQPATLIPMWNESHHRNYTMALVAQSTPVQFQVVGQPIMSLTLQAGWNVLNMPPDTTWGLPSSATANVSVTYCASNAIFGNAI